MLSLFSVVVVRISPVGNGKVVKSVVNAWVYNLCQIDWMLVDEVNSMSNGQGTMVHGYGVW